MGIVSRIADNEESANSISPAIRNDFESGRRVIHAAVEALQRNFKHDTRYARPLMSPQANILFALDKDAAADMIAYMTDKLREAGDFEESEFRFIRKFGGDEEMLQRVRLEFSGGVDARIVRKLRVATERLEQGVPC